MSFENKIILTVVYAILAVAFAGYIYFRIRKKKAMGAIDFFNLYYLLVYFVVPIFFFYNSYIGFKRKYALFLDYDLRYHILALICAIVFIVLVNVFYEKMKIKSGKKFSVNIKGRWFLIMNMFFSVVGIFSYYMWTKAYGFPFGILQYADKIRDNVFVMDNPYTYFQPLSNFVIFASYNWLLLLKEYRKDSNKIFAFIMFLITFFFAVLAAFATDGRFNIIILFSIPILFFVSGKRFDFKKILIFGIIALFVLGKMDGLTSSIRGKTYERAEAGNIFELVSHEFGFTYSNRINLFYNLEHGDVKISEWDDIKNAIIFWIPKSMKPDNYQALGKYNTSFYENPSGEVPTDVVTAAIYKGRIFGILFLALFIAFVLKFFDNRFLYKNDSFTKMFYLYFCVAIMLRMVAYYEMSNLLFGRLAFIIYYLAMFMVCGRNNNDKDLDDGDINVKNK